MRCPNTTTARDSPYRMRPSYSLKRPNLTKIFNKISDISDSSQINAAMLEVPTVKERSKLLEMILHRKNELEDLNHFMRFHNIGSLLQKVKAKMMYPRLMAIRERKEQDQPKTPFMRRMTAVSTPGFSPKAKRASVMATFKPPEKQSFSLGSLLQNPKTTEMVVTIFRAMQSRKKQERKPIDGSKKQRVLIWNPANYKKEYAEYQDFIKKHINVKTRQEVFNKIRIDHLKKMEKLKMQNKLKNAETQLEEDLCGFLIRENIEKPLKDKIDGFFENSMPEQKHEKIGRKGKGKAYEDTEHKIRCQAKV